MQKRNYFCSVSLWPEEAPGKTVCYKVQNLSPREEGHSLNDVAVTAVERFAAEHIFGGPIPSVSARAKIHVCDELGSHLGERTVLASIRADRSIISQRIVDCEPSQAGVHDSGLSRLLLFCQAEQTMSEIRNMA